MLDWLRRLEVEDVVILLLVSTLAGPVLLFSTAVAICAVVSCVADACL